MKKLYDMLSKFLNGRQSYIRLLLILSLFAYLPAFGPLPLLNRTADSGSLSGESANGMGGGTFTEKTDTLPYENLEISGVPEPEELSMPHMLTFASYTMESGDIIGHIAAAAGLSEDTLISVNNIKNTRLMQIGQVIRIPNQDGIYYSVKSGDTLEGIAQKYETTVYGIRTANELFSEELPAGVSLFIPGARMDWVNRQEINGDLFIWPCSGYITSLYGYRKSPFSGVRQFHSGLDIGAGTGTPVKAAMAGRVVQVTYNDILGNHIVVSHHSGYRTVYAHLSETRVKAGAYVEAGQRIGDVGNTGLSTGPHLHFTVYKNGVTVNPRTLMK